MTREEAKEIFLNRGFIDGIYDGNKWREACIVISKWLEQEPILDKIKQIVDRPIGNNAEEKAYNYMMIVKDIKEIIDKYKREMEK